VFADLTPPEVGDAIDGNRPNFEDTFCSSAPAIVQAQWRGFQDPESAIKDVEIRVLRTRYVMYIDSFATYTC
jgi:hypothetical protein